MPSIFVARKVQGLQLPTSSFCAQHKLADLFSSRHTLPLTGRMFYCSINVLRLYQCVTALLIRCCLSLRYRVTSYRVQSHTLRVLLKCFSSHSSVTGLWCWKMKWTYFSFGAHKNKPPNHNQTHKTSRQKYSSHTRGHARAWATGKKERFKITLG